MKAFETLSRVEAAILSSLKLDLNEQVTLQESASHKLLLLEQRQSNVNEDCKNNIAPGKVLSLDSQIYFDRILFEISDNIKILEDNIKNIINRVSELESEIKSSFTRKKSVDKLLEKKEIESSERYKRKEYEEMDDRIMQNLGSNYGS